MIKFSIDGQKFINIEKGLITHEFCHFKPQDRCKLSYNIHRGSIICFACGTPEKHIYAKVLDTNVARISDNDFVFDIQFGILTDKQMFVKIMW